MTKTELIASVAGKTGSTKAEIGRILDVTLETIAGADVVTLRGFGTFKKKIRKARTGRNPQTGTAIEIPEKIVLTFKA